METKHTPGPWTVVKNGNSKSLVRYSDGENVTYVAQCNDMQFCPEHGTVEANARLIAAAPELLAALENLFEHCAMMHKHWGEASNAKEAEAAIQAGRAAIAKATGND